MQKLGRCEACAHQEKAVLMQHPSHDRNRIHNFRIRLSERFYPPFVLLLCKQGRARGTKSLPPCDMLKKLPELASHGVLQRRYNYNNHPTQSKPHETECVTFRAFLLSSGSTHFFTFEDWRKHPAGTSHITEAKRRCPRHMIPLSGPFFPIEGPRIICPYPSSSPCPSHPLSRASTCLQVNPPHPL